MGLKKKAVSNAKIVLQPCESCGENVPILYLSKEGKKICFKCHQLEMLPSGVAA